jgi:hypothetical protein
MRRTILLSLFALLAAGVAHHACGQRRGGGGPGATQGGHGFSRFRGASRYGFSDAYLPYDYDGAYSYEPEPVLFVEPPPLVVEPPPAPPAARPTGHAVVTEYKWPAAALAASASPTAMEPESESFGIVLKDGSTLSAVMVFVSSDGLHYVDRDERHLCISMSEIDRAATLRLNRERNLNLHLPAEQ